MLLGRVAERQRIAALLDGAREGRSGVLALVGEPGIGKTALLDDAVGTAEGFTVLRARGVESEARIPFASLLELCRPALGALAAVPRPQAVALESALALRPAQPAERFAIGAGVLSLLAAVADRHPLLVALDDAHWFDPSSGEALRFALRRLVADRIAVLIAVREGEASFLDGSDIDRWPLGGLSAAEVVELLAQQGHGTELAERVGAATGGNPLALIELARSADLLSLSPGAGTVVPVSAALAHGFLRRVESLDPDARQVLLLAAAHDGGDAATLEQASHRLGVDFSALTRAEAAGVVGLREGQVEFRHPLVRSAVYSAAPAGARREVHRALAAVLSDRDVDRRAWHLASAAVGTDPVAAEAMRQAGERARERTAYAVASAAYERAAALASDDGGRAALLCDAAQSAWLAGLDERAGELVVAARTAVPAGVQTAGLAHLEGQLALHRGPVMDAHAVLTAAAGTEADPALAVELLADATIASFFAGRPAEMLATATMAEERLPARPSPRARYLATMAKGMALILGGDAQQGALLVRDGVALLSSDDGMGDPRWTAWTVMGPMWLREGTAGRAIVDHALDAARRQVAVGALPFLLTYLARDQAGGDAWPAAVACYDESIRISRETGERTDLAMSLAGLAWLEARQGHEARCRAHAEEARDLCRRLGTDFFAVWTLAALGDLELGLGNAAVAAGHYRDQADLLAERGITDPDVSPVPDLVDAYVRLGEREAARELASSFQAAAARKGQAWSAARASRALGLVADDQEFDAWFAQALAAQRATPDSFELARTQLAYGARLRRARRRAEARAPLREAFGVFDRLGAHPWADAAQVELQATGETIRSRDAGALEKLTPQEVQIALLLSSGRTTREAAAALFVSPKTVEYHLRHVYEKLGVRSREGLRRALDQRPS